MSERDDRAPDPGSPEQAQDEAPASDEKQGLSVLQVLGSVLAAMFGVQSSERRRRDFEQGRVGVFIAAGVIFGLVFVVAIYLVVSLVLSQAGKG
ncbi:MAG: DUF2970 domain-containing protein [Halieaceae bacterium]|jgi:hypothetical protein|nr:DUF2970 domain-containing protein [Halieaceae bacterium]